MVQLEKAWFGQTPSCPDLTSSVSSNNIGLNSFWGLFLIAGVASSVALILCIATFLYENRDTFKHLDPRASVWRQIKAMATRFDDKDLSSHTFRNSEMVGRSSINGVDAVTASPATNFPPSPSSLSIQTESNSAFVGGRETPSSEYGEPLSPI